MLYIFAGYPKCGLNAGGVQHAVESVENLAILEHDPAIQYAKEGVVAVGRDGGNERLGPVEYHISPAFEAAGVTWNWFPENWGFGQGVTVHKVTANRETMLVDHRTGASVPDLIASGSPLALRGLVIQLVPKRTEGWEVYERRWRPGTCPQESHIVHLTWLVTKHRIQEFAYSRLRDLIETPGTALRDAERYRAKDFSPERRWDGKQLAMPRGLLAGGF